MGLDDYIGVHLAYELKYLLVAATTWQAVQHPGDREPWPPHLVVMSMDSAFVHARVLYEFVTREDHWKRTAAHMPRIAPLWVKYEDAMHRRVLHPDPRRPQAAGTQHGDDLKDRVVDFARDLLALWDDITTDPQMRPYRSTMSNTRAAAVADAKQVADAMRIAPLFA